MDNAVKKVIYDLYIKCFPEYPTSTELFQSLLRPESSHLIYTYHNEKIVGFSMIHGNSISLLCVEQEYRNRGYGSYLLDESEKYIIRTGAAEILLGRGPHYLLQGVPNDSLSAVSFFKNKGYTASWTSVNMILSLETFHPETLDIPEIPDMFTFRFAEDSDVKPLLDAVKDAEPSWQSIFKTCADPILLAMCNEKIVGFEILLPNGGRFVLLGQKAGSIGCVGVINEARNLGIGRRMVVFGAEWLKNLGCTSIELRYVYLVEWYSKIGFIVARHQWMGEKKLMISAK